VSEKLAEEQKDFKDLFGEEEWNTLQAVASSFYDQIRL
jgi:hypothetical protein